MTEAFAYQILMTAKEHSAWIKKNALMKWIHIGVNANMVLKEKTAKSAIRDK